MQDADIEEFLRAEGSSVAGIAARFAYQAGLLPTEMVNLKWPDFDLDKAVLAVGTRQIPISDDFLPLLKGRKSAYGNATKDHLVYFLDSGEPVHREQISKWARLALDRFGLYDVTLASLRNLFISNLLCEHGWEYTSQITGLKYAALYNFTKKHNIPTSRLPASPTLPTLEEAEKIVLSHDEPPAGTILRLAFYMGLSQGEMAELKWKDIDLHTGKIAAKSNLMPADLVSYLSELKAKNSRLSDYVIIGCRDHKALPSAYISRLGKQILVDAGYKDLTLKTLYREALLDAHDKNRIVDFVRGNGPSTKKEIAAGLALPENSCDYLFSALTREDQLRTGGDSNNVYYLPEQQTPYDRQAEAVVQYIRDNGSITASQAAALLSFEKREQYYLLNRMAKEKLIKKHGDHYVI